MGCKRGRVRVSRQTKLRLFADAAGYCNQPQCKKRLFSDEDEVDYHIAEMAHILAAEDGGPRAAPQLDAAERASYNNLILLCPNCHTTIDKCSEQFPDEKLRDWKLQHKTVIAEAIGVQSVSSRDEALEFLNPLFHANRIIHQTYGPDNDYRENPEAEEAKIWKRKMIHQIIPNNQKVLLFIDKNIRLINDSERETVELFRQHLDDLVERHLGGNEEVASRYPPNMDALFRTQ